MVQVREGKIHLNGGFHPDDGTTCFDLVTDYGTVDEPGGLLTCLRQIFEMRTKQFAVKRGMEQRTDLPLDERIEKTVYLRPNGALNHEQETKFVDLLKTAGANPVIVLSEDDYKKKFGSLFEPISPAPVMPKPVTSSTSARTIEGGVLNGKATSLPQPAFPEAAKHSHQSGTVVVQVLVDESGKVLTSKVLSGPTVFREPARQAALMATFSPTKLAGNPVKVRGVIVYRFVG